MCMPYHICGVIYFFKTVCFFFQIFENVDNVIHFCQQRGLNGYCVIIIVVNVVYLCRLRVVLLMLTACSINVVKVVY